MKTEKKILTAFLLNTFFSIFEFIGGLFTGSVAIMSDALHDLGDAISIGLAFVLERKSKKDPDNMYTYGYVRYSILGAFVNSAILFIGAIVIGYAAITRFMNPTALHYDGMIVFAIVGVVVNFLATYFTREGDSLNQKAVNLHMLEDVINWGIVLVGSIIMKFTNINYIDSILCFGMAIFLIVQASKNLKLILDLFLEKTPKNISVEDLKTRLMTIEGITQIHHVHLWSLDGIQNYATMHVVTNNQDGQKIKQQIRKLLGEYHIGHATIELETKKEKCEEQDCHVQHADVEHHHHHH